MLVTTKDGEVNQRAKINVTVEASFKMEKLSIDSEGIRSRSPEEISYIGYKKQNDYITDQGFINVKLVSDNEMLSEVVIVGAGTQKKVSVTGAITSVKGTTLKTPSSSLTNSIAGKLAGVVSTTVPVRVRFLLFCETSRRLFCVSTSRTVRLLITNGVSATLNSLAAVTDNGQLNKQSSEYLSHPALLIKRSFSMFLDLDN